MTTHAPDCGIPGQPLAKEVLEGVLFELTSLHEELIAVSDHSSSRLDEVHNNNRGSACNLLQYLALRRHDLRPLQERLAELGLSSLGRAESHVLATIEAVLFVVRRLTGSQRTMPESNIPAITFAMGRRLLAEHTDGLLGSPSPGRDVRIMVTVPTEAASDATLVHDLLQQGMNAMRINCAHDDRETWKRMIDHLKRAERHLNRPCKVVMDLAGPKLRTGPMESGPAVARIRPQRDEFGRVTAPARVWLAANLSAPSTPSSATASLPVPKSWLAEARTREWVSFTDARHSKRRLQIVEVLEHGCWAELRKTAYLIPGTILHHERDDVPRQLRDAPVGRLPHLDLAIPLKRGDLLILTRDLTPGRPAIRNGEGHDPAPARIGCTIPDVFDDVKPGESIWFDDGKIGGLMEQVEADRIVIRITHARLRGEKLRADKGINLPDSNLRLAAMTAKDLEDLSFVAQHADVIELSFANRVQDVEALQKHLASPGGRQPAIVLKIETRRGFENLPEMLLTAMRLPQCGVMIARGDLAVECGFERLAEVQEEILWICEAAHVPVIWATQVLESLAKEGMPSRAEITDAAMGNRAECVMLNKGPHIVRAVKVLDNILRRMESHQDKKRAMLRELRLAHMQPVYEEEEC